MMAKSKYHVRLADVPPYSPANIAPYDWIDAAT